MWSHNENKEISDIAAKLATIRCPHCGRMVRKYVDSHYTGGSPCVLLANYCRYCRGDLDND